MVFLFAFSVGALIITWAGAAAALPAKDTPEGVVPPGYEGVMEGAVDIQPHFPGITVGILSKEKSGRPHVFYFYPKTGNSAVDRIVYDRVTRDAREFFDEVAKEKRYEASAKLLKNWRRYSNYEISRPSDNIINIVFGFGGYQGGNGPWYYKESLYFHLPDGKQLCFNDLFDNPQMALQLMSAWSRKHIEDLLIKEGTPPGEVQKERFAEGTAPKKENFSKLKLRPDGIDIYFDYYQVKVGVDPDTYMPLRELKKAGPRAQIWGQ
ncbi:MAG: hypothetical protein BCS36_14190 [Desulfovibrio sp. MES5]|nr:MAG: hypothetical protein BCS36_14190 [Desulfovibrio sp. MES5]